jgi:ABC-type glycerol-3-phosphate transport system substrate-binding protein
MDMQMNRAGDSFGLASKQPGRRAFLAGGGALGLAAFLAACSSGKSSSAAATGGIPTAAAGTTNFAGKSVAGAFENAPLPGMGYKNVVRPQWVAKTHGAANVSLIDYNTLYQDVTLDLTSGTHQYDFFGSDILWAGQMGTNNGIQYLNDYVNANADLRANINPVLLKGLTWNKNLVGLPATNQSWNLFYRKDVFDKYGYTPPTNWDDFLGLAKELTSDWGTGTKHYGVAMPVLGGAIIAQDWLGYFAASGGELFDNWPNLSKTNYNPQFNSDQGVAALELYQKMRAYAPPDVAAFDWTKTQQALLSGQVAMVCQWNQIVGEASTGKVLDDIGWARLPNAPGIERFDPRGCWSVAIEKNSPHVDEAWDFVSYAAGKEVQRAMVESQPGSIPIRDDLVSELKSTSGANSYLGFFEEIAKNPNPMNFAWRPTIPPANDIFNILGLQLNEAMTGNLTAKNALGAVNSQVTTVMKNAGY